MSTHILKKGYTALAWPTSAKVTFSDLRPEERLLFLDPPVNDSLVRDMSKALGSKYTIEKSENAQEYYEIVKDLLNSDIVKEMKNVM